MKCNTRHLISIFSIQNNQEQSGILSLLFFLAPFLLRVSLFQVCQIKMSLNIAMETEAWRSAFLLWSRTTDGKPEPKQRSCHCAHVIMISKQLNVRNCWAHTVEFISIGTLQENGAHCRQRFFYSRICKWYLPHFL